MCYRQSRFVLTAISLSHLLPCDGVAGAVWRENIQCAIIKYEPGC